MKRDPQVEQVSLSDYTAHKMSMFSEWTREEQQNVFKAHAMKVLDGKPAHAGEVDRVVKSVAGQYYEEHPEAKPF